MNLIEYCTQKRAYLQEQMAVPLSEDKLNNGTGRLYIVDLGILIARYDKFIAELSKLQPNN